MVDLQRLRSLKPPVGEPVDTGQVDDLLLVLGIGPDSRDLQNKRLSR